MKSIIELELKNLSNAEKEKIYKKYSTSFVTNEEWIIFKKYSGLEKMMKEGFLTYPKDFIDFQKSHENSLYNQTLKKHDFKDLDYKDMVESLTQEQKSEIVRDIINIYPSLTYEDADYPELIFKEINKEDITEFEKKSEYKQMTSLSFQKWYFGGELEKYKENKYVSVKKPLLVQDNEFYVSDEDLEAAKWEVKFFKNANEAILWSLEDYYSGDEMVKKHEELLNPHYKVNNWIVTNHELELAQKDDLEQTQKFEEPKLKM
ncbi:hypothetical protein R7V42_02110 [Mesomycoplasma ovipneumoniae]|uniref:hypothetical protein n=1 Tax=Mesomycoplasma ovipneumoniae TaxID=29562 RepID=UPI00296571AB|nr:hypothetical protein [Mesomycoplasma ovipneumoniae]MDW2834894.1 hypothetical protein [Mesomycoplasma ovipneumoniae]